MFKKASFVYRLIDEAIFGNYSDDSFSFKILQNKLE